MTELTEASSVELLEMTTEIVSSYVSHHAISLTDLPALIAETHAALCALGNAVPEDTANELKPAVPVKKSITPDYLICLEDGEKFKSLKRHLASRYNLTPEQYREKWGLPRDYPMVAPGYSARRSALAKESGLGRKSTAK